MKLKAKLLRKDTGDSSSSGRGVAKKPKPAKKYGEHQLEQFAVPKNVPLKAARLLQIPMEKCAIAEKEKEVPSPAKQKSDESDSPKRQKPFQRSFSMRDSRREVRRLIAITDGLSDNMMTSKEDC